MKREVKELDHKRQLEIEYRNVDSDTDLTLYKKCQNVCNINDLDDDVILQIFSHLDDLRDKTISELGRFVGLSYNYLFLFITFYFIVCKRWHKLMLQLWSSQNCISFANTFNRFGSPGIQVM